MYAVGAVRARSIGYSAMAYDYDLFTIGAGSGGTRATRLTAALGLKAAVAEEYRIGGTCVVRGCVPKKLLVYASEFSQAFKDAGGFGWSVEWARFDWSTLRNNVQDEVSRLSSIYRANLIKSGADIFEERAEIVGPHEVRLLQSGRVVTAERILVASGGRVVRPEGMPGAELAITSDEAFLIERLPERVVVVGGGYIAVEFAQIFQGLGVETTLVYRGEHVLRGFDDDVRWHVTSAMQEFGIRIDTGASPLDLTQVGGRQEMRLSNGQTLTTDLAMFAIGRAPYTRGLGLENAGVELDAMGAVKVDAYSRTTAPSVFAIGDVTNRVNLTPVAIREAVAFVETEFKDNPTAMDHGCIATAVFGRPPVGAVGLTEDEARVRFGPVDIYKTTFRPMKNVLAKNPEKMLMKLVVRPSDGVVVGVHAVGDAAPEMIQMAAIAVKAGLTKAQWDATVAVHPTAAEEFVLLREKAG
jgi:glutathione reductase (NADPH)